MHALWNFLLHFGMSTLQLVHDSQTTCNLTKANFAGICNADGKQLTSNPINTTMCKTELHHLSTNFWEGRVGYFITFLRMKNMLKMPKSSSMDGNVGQCKIISIF